MRLLQRYILLDMLRVFLSLVSVLTVLLVFVGVFQQVSESGLGPVQILQILPFVVPSLLPFTIPATLLLTVCLVYGRMAGHREITAAKAAGVNVMSLLWPAFLLAAAMSVCSLYLSDQVIPWAVGNIQRTVTSAIEDIFLDVLRTRHKFSDPRQGFTITVMKVRDRTLIEPTFQYRRNGGDPVTLRASAARMQFDLERQVVDLHLNAGYIVTPSGTRVWLQEAEYAIPLPPEIREAKPRHLAIRSIRKRLDDIDTTLQTVRDRRDAEAALAYAIGDFDHFTDPKFLDHDRIVEQEEGRFHRHRTEMHGRFALAGSCFFFVFLGAPVAILQGRRQFLTTFLLCFLPILLTYYPIVLGMMSLSKTGQVDPVWAMWIGNAALAAAGGYYLFKVLRY